MIVDTLKYAGRELDIELNDAKTVIEVEGVAEGLLKEEFGDLIRELTEVYHEMK